MPVVSLPKNLTGSTARAFVAALPDAPGEALRVNVDALAFATVAGVAPLIEGLCAYAARTGVPVVVEEPAAPTKVHGWLAWVGGFRALGSDWGRAGEAGVPGETYLPVTVLRRSDLEAEAARDEKPLGHIIHRRCVALAEVVTEKKDGKVVEPVAYCFRELVRNVFEHAGVDRCTVMAQRRAKADCVEVAVADAGAGIRATLGRRHPAATDADALALALLPGRSGSPTFGGDDPYANSGFGLFVLSELGRRTGTFRIASGDAELRLSAKGIEAKSARWAGTTAEISVSKPKGVNFPAFIEAIIEKGRRASPAHRAPMSTRLV